MEAVLTTVLLLIAVVFVLGVLGWFWVGEGYLLPPEELGPAERAWVAREAGELLAELAPRVILLAGREKAVEVALRGEEGGVLGLAVRRRLEEADLLGFWVAFSLVSVVVEEDPARAVRELPALRARLEERLDACDEVLGMLGGVRESVERGEGRG
ncbi:MAG: hypothetical protein ACRDTR_09300, partial [Rubrobacter sp.]